MTYYLPLDSEVLAINSAAAVPADGTSSVVYAIPQRARILAMSVRPVGTFDTISVNLYISNQPDTGFSVLKNSTATAGEMYQSSALAAKYCKVVLASSTGASRTGIVIGLYAK